MVTTYSLRVLLVRDLVTVMRKITKHQRVN